MLRAILCQPGVDLPGQCRIPVRSGQASGFFTRSNGLRGTLHLGISQRHVRQGVEVVGLQLQSQLILLEGFRQLTDAGQCRRQVGVGFGIIWIELQSQFKLADGFCWTVGFEQGISQVVARLEKIGFQL